MLYKTRKNLPFLLMVLPGFIWLLVIKYLPIGGRCHSLQRFFAIFPGGFINSFVKKRMGGI